MSIEIDGMICTPIDRGDTEDYDVPMQTCPPDPRFQQQNTTKWCYIMFVDFHRCVNLLGKKEPKCKLFERCYKSICPNAWIEEWNAQIEKGTFPRNIAC